MIIRSLKLSVLFGLWAFFQTHPSFACRYNVRETGFVYLGSDPYYLCGYFTQDTPTEIVSRFQQIAANFLLDSNIEVEIIEVDQQRDHPAMKYLDSLQIKSFPAAVLVSPDGQSLVVPITKPNQPFQQTLCLALEDMISSPKREEIIRKAIKHYGVILLIEGKNTEENQKSRDEATAAIEQIRTKMDLMPKPIDYPPALVVLDRESIHREKVLLWSLGLDADKINQTHAAVIYGRARWIGPLLKGDKITKSNLSELLLIIGADCECGLDKSWLQGTMLPGKWDKKIQRQVAKSLGFDPENPMIKAEINRIMRMGITYPNNQITHSKVTDENPEAENHENEKLINNSTSSHATDSTRNLNLEKSSFVFQTSVYFISGFLLLIIIIGIIVFSKRHKFQ